jgi:DNA-binding NtrC family response regulator
MHRVMLVDDDAAFCYAAQRALENSGFEVEAFQSTLAAWSHVGPRSRFDVLVVDLVFPPGQPNGLALARSAAQHRPGLPVVFISGFDDAMMIAKGDSDCVLRKPVELATLVTTVQDLLAGVKPT